MVELTSKERQLLKDSAELLQNALEKPGDKVTVRGFGTFKRVLRPERKARNPKTGEDVIVPERLQIVFKGVK